MRIPKFIGNLLSVYSANAINGVLGIISVPVIVTLLGNKQYGVFSIYSVLASYVALVDFGVTKHFIGLMASNRDKEKQSAYLQKAFGWYLGLSVILISALPLLIYIVTEYIFPLPDLLLTSLRWIVIFSVIEFFLAIPTMITQAYTLSNEYFRQHARFIAISGIYRYGLMLLAAWLFKNPVAVVAFLVFRRIFDFIAARFILPKPPASSWKPRVNFREFRTILAHSSFMSLSQVLQTTIVAIGSVLINRSFGVAVLGNYRAAFDLGSKVWFFSNGIGVLVFPRFSKILSDNSERLNLLKKMVRWLEQSWIIYMLFSLLAILLGRFILNMVKLGDEQIVLFFMILIVGICLNAHSNVSYEFLLADRRYKTVALLVSCALVLMILSFKFLSSIAGPYAIAWAWIISQSLYALIADEIAVHNNLPSPGTNVLVILVKFAILFMTLFCLFAGLNFYPINIHIIAPVVFISGLYVVLRDTKVLKLSLK